jgi:hypothetical protein
MKKAISKTRTITAMLISIFMLGFTPVTKSEEKNETVEKNQSATIKFMGKLTNGPLFQVKMNNTEADEFSIRILDADENLLYAERLKGVNIFRNYQLAIDRDELYEALNVRFEITSLKTKQTFIYNVSNKSRTVSDIIIAKL